MRTCALTLILLAFTCAAAQSAEEKLLRSDHAAVTYVGIDEPHAQAITRIVAAARNAAADRFGFDMPASIAVTVNCRPDNTVRLFNDGQDHFDLTVRSAADLAQPGKSGIYHVYGLCHEVAHLAMYRPIHDRDWLTTAAAEGWAHYMGSRLVDLTYAAEGDKTWPDPYDYRADGTRRLEDQLRQAKRDPTVQGAALWQELAAIVGDRQIASIFRAWGQATVDPADPGAALRAALLATVKDDRLGAWWNKAEPIFVFKRPRSGFAARTLAKSAMGNHPLELARDDGQSSGKSSIAGGGHAVSFEAPGAGRYLTTVRVFGSRYGAAQAPNESFRLWLCDPDGNVIRELAFPYSLFRRGDARWVDLSVEPTEVPHRFTVYIGFNPTASKGVFVHYAGGEKGNSRSGLPGKPAPFDKGNWMIRAILDQPATADSLRPRP